MHSTLNSFNREVSRHFDQFFSGYRLATSYVELLLLVGEKGDLSQKEIAQKMNLAPSTITRFIKKLEKKNLIEKKRDGRLVNIELTALAKKEYPNWERLYKQARLELAEKLGEQFVSTTGRLLEHGTDLLKK